MQAVGICRTITSILMLGLLKKSGHCEAWNKCYMILLESPLGSFGSSHVSIYACEKKSKISRIMTWIAECTRPLLTLALISGWLFEICPGVMLLVGAIQVTILDIHLSKTGVQILSATHCSSPRLIIVEEMVLWGVRPLDVNQCGRVNFSNPGSCRFQFFYSQGHVGNCANLQNTLTVIYFTAKCNVLHG